MTKAEYAAYLLTPSWKRRRKEILDRRSWRCQNCGLDCSIWQRRDYIHLHHLNYENLGHERANDLAALCKKCHYELHDEGKGLLTDKLARKILMSSHGGRALLVQMLDAKAVK